MSTLLQRGRGWINRRQKLYPVGCLAEWPQSQAVIATEQPQAVIAVIEHKPLAVAMLDLDHFKHFNDVYGHESGDRVLQMMGRSLCQSLRASDVACRYGGEELTVVMPGSSLDDARARLDTIRQTIMQRRLPYRDGELPAITVSIGVATAGPEDPDASAVLARADVALYQAKEQGRNRVVVATLVSDP